jgi:hypothetical protein
MEFSKTPCAEGILEPHPTPHRCMGTVSVEDRLLTVK